jgi:hypothetical protein
VRIKEKKKKTFQFHAKKGRKKWKGGAHRLNDKGSNVGRHISGVRRNQATQAKVAHFAIELRVQLFVHSNKESIRDRIQKERERNSFRTRRFFTVKSRWRIFMLCKYVILPKEKKKKKEHEQPN